MKSFFLTILLVVMGSLTACMPTLPNFVVANNYTGPEWKNGILQKDGKSDEFYFLQKGTDISRWQVGRSLLVAKTGDVVITKVERTNPPDQNGTISVFVTVNKNLDPIGDGYPNKIAFADSDK